MAKPDSATPCGKLILLTLQIAAVKKLGSLPHTGQEAIKRRKRNSVSWGHYRGVTTPPLVRLAFIPGSERE